LARAVLYQINKLNEVYYGKMNTTQYLLVFPPTELTTRDAPTTIILKKKGK
jgi:hypothetical protein